MKNTSEHVSVHGNASQSTSNTTGQYVRKEDYLHLLEQYNQKIQEEQQYIETI